MDSVDCVVLEPDAVIKTKVAHTGGLGGRAMPVLCRAVVEPVLAEKEWKSARFQRPHATSAMRVRSRLPQKGSGYASRGNQSCPS